jgi:hypothetical protein
MTLTLTPSGVLAYNGVTFDALIKSRVNAKPIYDNANRQVEFVQHEIEAQAIISRDNLAGPPADTNAYLQMLRQKLTAPRKRLQYNLKGYGTFDINAPNGPVYDVKWGPKPELLAFVPIGREFTCAVTWKVTTCIPECAGSSYINKLMAATWEVDYDIGSDGLTTITTNGSIKIPLNQGRDFLVDNADRWREQLAFDVPLGFKRIQQTFKLSNDRSELSFSIVDKQLPVPLVNGTVEIDIKHSIVNDKAVVTNGGPWTSRFTGSIKVSPATPKSFAWDAFVAITSKRILYTISTPFPALAPGAAPRLLTVLPSKLEVQEDIFQLTTNFSFTYKIYGARLDIILSAAGLWQPPDTTWAAWRASLRDNAHHIRGTLKVRYRNIDDTLLDLCTPGTTDPPRAGAESTVPAAPSLRPEPISDATAELIGSSRLTTTGPSRAPEYGETEDPNNSGSNFPFDPNETWIEYNPMLIEDENDHIVRHKPLAGRVTVSTQVIDPTNLAQVAGQRSTSGPAVTVDVPDDLQRLTGPSKRVTLKGEALRIAFPIEIPRLLTYRGSPVVQRRQRITGNTVVGNMGGWPIIARMWEIEYEVLQARSGQPGLPILANPLTQTNGAS